MGGSGAIQDVVVPAIGESVTTAYVGRLLKRPGEGVHGGDSLLVLDSDKASMELPSPVAGVLVEWRVAEGDEVPIGALLARIDTSRLPDAPEGVRAPPAGPAVRQLAAERGVDLATVAGSGVRGRILRRDVGAVGPAPDEPVEPPNEETAGPAAYAPEPPPELPTSEVPTWRANSNFASRLPEAAEGWEGGPGGKPLVSPPWDAGEARAADRFERIPMTPIRRTIARRMVEAHQKTAMLTTFNEVDMSRVTELRRAWGERFARKFEVKLGLMSFFVKASVEALKAFPAVNAEVDESDPSHPAIVYKHYYNIGVAVSTDRGLVVPVLRDADRLSFAETERAIGELARKGREGLLLLDDFHDGTFSVSNGGVFGSLLSTPMLNPPQVGILGMHAIQERPVGVGGKVELRPMMYVALTYDHRVIDGREAVSFLFRVKELVEAPERLLLEV